ncbi:MAG TPA: rod shape-determining protein MreC [Kofleriaceae bacterium]|nr:rod shape-determining protein MreC [Kofleriaceae bacterium]
MTPRRRLVDWGLTGLLILLPALVLRASLSRGTPSALDEALLRITAPLETAVSWVVEGVGGTWSRYVALVDVEAENRELRDENERLRKALAAMTRRAYDVAALEDLAVVKKRTPADTVGARVIGAPLSPQFRVLRLRVDRGDHEVAPDMPVITSEGPVGRVDKVYGDYADVVLISDPSSRIDVVIRDPAQAAPPSVPGPAGLAGSAQPVAPAGGVRGLLVGMGRPDSYACKIEWLERGGRQGVRQATDAKVKVGDEVVTSGLGASFPAGLVVGKVSKIIGDDGMFQSVEVIPTVDVSRVRAVMVLLAPPPPPDPDAKSRRRSEAAFGTRPL